ncbi:MAG: hydroxymethylbilane synthase [Epsilonproteobacteria bacterium]|nr:hydroxymethylbilane synthase [Campylobacterota bacterium]
MKKIVIATRGSKLALWQSEYIKSELLKIDPNLDIHLKIVVTTGDKILDKPLANIGGKGLFIKEVEDELLNGNAQIAVHSLKDFAVEYDTEHFDLTAITKREDVRDTFLSQKYETLADLPEGAVVGTSSIRRVMQLKDIRPDLTIKDLRGNVDTRIRKLKDGQYDAIILARAGLKRLGLLNSVKYSTAIDTDLMIPAMGQGALGIETNKDPEIMKLVAKLDHKETRICTTIEREFVKELNLGCHAPVGIKAKFLDDGNIRVKAVLLKGDTLLRKEIVSDEFENLGIKFAEEFK